MAFAGPYAKIKFPPYEHREYPKWITLASGERRLVENQREELLAVGSDPIAGQPENPLVSDNRALADKVIEQQQTIEQLLRDRKQLVEARVATTGTPQPTPANASEEPLPNTPLPSTAQPSSPAKPESGADIAAKLFAGAPAADSTQPPAA